MSAFSVFQSEQCRSPFPAFLLGGLALRRNHRPRARWIVDTGIRFHRADCLRLAPQGRGTVEGTRSARRKQVRWTRNRLGRTAHRSYLNDGRDWTRALEVRAHPATGRSSAGMSHSFLVMISSPGLPFPCLNRRWELCLQRVQREAYGNVRLRLSEGRLPGSMLTEPQLRQSRHRLNPAGSHLPRSVCVGFLRCTPQAFYSAETGLRAQWAVDEYSRSRRRQALS